jgi:ribonuclease HII
MIFPEDYEIGVDEAGRGCFYGPVVAAAVVLPLELPGDEWDLIKDSKKLSEKKRKMLAEFIKSKALYYGIAEASHTEIDKMNILKASLKAMHRAIHDCYKQSITHQLPIFKKIYVDGNHFIPYIPPKEDAEMIPYQCVVQGDDKYLHIAAASILAKTYRDDLLIEQCEQNPILKQYDIQHNKGYGTKKHRDALKQYGPIEGHRMTYRPVKESIISDA